MLPFATQFSSNKPQGGHAASPIRQRYRQLMIPKVLIPGSDASQVGTLGTEASPKSTTNLRKSKPSRVLGSPHSRSAKIPKKLETTNPNSFLLETLSKQEHKARFNLCPKPGVAAGGKARFLMFSFLCSYAKLPASGIIAIRDLVSSNCLLHSDMTNKAFLLVK